MIPFGPSSGGGVSIAADGFIDVLGLDELPPGSQRSVAYGIQRVLLCHTLDGVHAVADLCPHALQPLAGSGIEGRLLRCAKHGALFDMATGAPQNGVTSKVLRVYPVRIRAGRIEISIVASSI